MKMILLLCAAGALGTLSRFFSVKAVNVFVADSCWGTLAVNVTGAFLAGFFFVLCKNKFAAYQAYFSVLFIGFLGAFTTFSTFALESTRCIADGQYGKFFLNILLQNLCGIGAAAGGFFLAKILFKG